MPSNRHAIPSLVSVLVLASFIGCGTESTDTEAPAHVENPVEESDLTTIHLTGEAVARIGIETGTIDDRTVQRRRSFAGELMAPPGSSIKVTAPRAGIIMAPEGTRIPRAGAAVGSGQPLLRLLALPAGDDILGGQSALSVAEARLDNARAKAERAERLLSEGVGSQAEFEDARAELRSAQAAFDAVRARQELMETGRTSVDLSNLSPIVLAAPAAGVVQGVHVAPGQTVVAGMALMEIVDANRLWVRVPVYVGILSEVDRDAGATVVRPGDPAGMAGVVANAISGPPTADPRTVSSDLYYLLPNAARTFRPGERVAVRVPLRGSGLDQRVVPWSAVLHDIHGGTWVYEDLGDHTYARRRVEVKDVVGDLAVLARGPEPGTSVVVTGAMELYSTEFGTAH